MSSIPQNSSFVFVLEAPPKAPPLSADVVLPPKALIAAAEADPAAKRAIHLPISGPPREVKLRASDAHCLHDLRYYLDQGFYSVVHSGKQEVLVAGDDDGLLRKLPTNRNLPSFVGPLLLTRNDRRGKTCDLPPECTLLTWKSFL